MSSPAPSNISIDSDSHIVPVPILLKGKAPAKYEQDALVVPQEVVASSTNFSELRLSPRTACAALEGHSPTREELIFIARGLAGVARQNEVNTQANRTQLAALKERGDALAKREAEAARLEETYKHWKTDRDQKLQEDTDDQGSLRDTSRTKVASVTSLFRLLTAPTPSMSSPPSSSLTDSTAWARTVRTSPSTDRSSSPHNASPSMRTGNTLSGSSMPSPTPLATTQSSPDPSKWGIGGSQLSFADTLIPSTISPPCKGNSTASGLMSTPCSSRKNNAADASSGRTPTRVMPSSGISKTAPTSKTDEKASSQ